MTLKAKSSEIDESLDDEDSKMKSYITRQFKKFMKNANGKGFDKVHRQSSSSQFKGQDKGKKDAKEGGQYTVPVGSKCFGCQGFGHMKHECPTYLKSIGKSKALATTLSDTEPEDDSNNENDKILNAFTAFVDPTEGIVEDVDEEEDLLDSKFEKMDEGIEEDYVILIVRIILRLGVAQGSSKCLALPNALEICRTLMFHVDQSLDTQNT